MSPEECVARLSINRRWLLLVGSQLGASSGVPVPFFRTPWSPSITDLVRYHIFRTQSREVSESVVRALEEGKAPLGFIADDLQGQRDWLASYTNNITPQKTLIRLADLIKEGMFHGIVSSAPDDLLERSLELLQIPYQPLSLEQPNGTPGVLPLLKEWDDLIFQDRADRRQREAAYVKAQLEVMIKRVDGVLMLGCHPFASDLMSALMKLAEPRQELQLIWVEETLGEGNERFPQKPTAPEWLAHHHQNFSQVVVNDLSQLLDEVAKQRGIEPTPIYEPVTERQGGLNGLLNRSFDVRPILVYVPGMALFSGLLDKLPKLSLKALLSLGALVLLLLGLLNYREYKQHDKQSQKARQLAALAKASYSKLREGKGSFQDLVRAEEALDEGNKRAKALNLPSPSVFTVPLLTMLMKRQLKKLRDGFQTTRSQVLIPALYKRRLKQKLLSSPLLRDMGHFPDVPVSIEQRDVNEDATDDKKGSLQAKKRKKNPGGFGSTQQVRPFSAHKKKPHLAIFASSSMLLRVFMYKQMRQDLQSTPPPLKDQKQKKNQKPKWLDPAPFVVPVDLEKLGNRPIEAFVLDTIRLQTGYTGRRKALFDASGIKDRLRKGRGVFYFLNLDTSGSLSQRLTQIQAFLAKYAKCKSLLATYLPETFGQIGEEATRFVRLKIESYRPKEARRYLRTHTSYRFYRDVMNNSYLRWNMKRPLIMSLLINYYQGVGQAPRSLGVIYDRLLRSMLDKSRFGLPTQFRALSILAYQALQHKSSQIQKEQAYQLLIKHNKQTLAQASKLLDELIKRGVLRETSLTHIGFMDSNFQYICVARKLRTLSFAVRKHFLLRQPQKIIGFYAGLYPKMTKLTKSWIEDYKSIDRSFRKKGVQLTWVNPHLPALKYAALAVNNGEVDHALIKQLETLLFELVQHKEHRLISKTVDWALTHMSTPGVKQFILEGIEQDASYDHRLFKLASLSPSDIYVGAIQRWTRRVRTQQDKQQTRRLSWEKKARQKLRDPKQPASQRKRLRRQVLAVRARARRSFARAMSLLVGLGTPDAIRTVMSVANRVSDPRFDKKSWQVVRLFSIYFLMVRGYFREVAPLLESLLHKHPERWQILVSRLYKANNARSAQLLTEVINQADVLPQLQRGSAGQKLAKQKLKVKRKAAKALSHLDADLSLPLLTKALKKAPSGAEDNRPYIALALGYIGVSEHFHLVKGLMKEWLQKSWPQSTPMWLRKSQTRALNKALALFGSKEAFAYLQSLQENPRWRSLSGYTDYLYNYIKHADAEHFFTERILCGMKPKRRFEKYRLLLRLAKMQTPSARARLNSLLQVKLGRDHKHFVQAHCNQQSGFSFARFRKLVALDDFVWALGRFREPGDLPRFARWALHPKRSVRRAAIVALGRYREPEAAHALLQSLARYPQNKLRIIKTLGRQRLPSNEAALLRLLTQHRTIWQQAKRKPARQQEAQKLLQTDLKALLHTGSFASLLRVIPLQQEPSLLTLANKAVYQLALRNRGTRWNAAQLQAAIKGLRLPTLPVRKPILLGQAKAPKKKGRRVSRIKRKTTRRRRKRTRRKRGFGFGKGGFGSFGRAKKGGFGFK